MLSDTAAAAVIGCLLCQQQAHCYGSSSSSGISKHEVVLIPEVLHAAQQCDTEQQDELAVSLVLLQQVLLCGTPLRLQAYEAPRVYIWVISVLPWSHCPCYKAALSPQVSPAKAPWWLPPS